MPIDKDVECLLESCLRGDRTDVRILTDRLLSGRSLFAAISLSLGRATLPPVVEYLTNRLHSSHLALALAHCVGRLGCRYSRIASIA